MFEKEFQEWFELNKKWLYSMDHVQAAYSAWCAGVKQQQAVEQPLAPDGFPPSHRDEPFCECSVCMGFVSRKPAAGKA